MGRGGQVASFEALTQGDDLEANNPAPNGLALGNEQALCAYADRAVAVTQQAGGEAHTTGRDGRLRLQAYPLADPQLTRPDANRGTAGGAYRCKPQLGDP